jgi:hypothetical protein
VNLRVRVGTLITLTVLSGAAIAAGASAPGLPTMSSAQSDYVEHCAGCHGIQGLSFPARVPRLRDRVGYFTCTDEGRRYLLRLPNVALSATDDDQLADIMNFVVFGLGGKSAEGATRRFTPAEVGLVRHDPLSSVSLTKTRATLVGRISKQCRLSKGALDF